MPFLFPVHIIHCLHRPTINPHKLYGWETGTERIRREEKKNASFALSNIIQLNSCNDMNEQKKNEIICHDRSNAAKWMVQILYG